MSTRAANVEADHDALLTAEDLDRSVDRMRVVKARSGRRRWLLVWLLLGPGVLAMLGENDGPSMLSYAASGADYGIGFFVPFIVVTFAAAAVVQEMAMRLAAVTHRGFGELIFQRFGRFWGWTAASDLVVTNLVTLISEIIAIRVGMAFFGVPALVAVGCALGLVLINSLGGRYSRWERVTMGIALFNMIFVPAAILAYPALGNIGRALGTWHPLPGGPSQQVLLIVASDIGATVTPWMLFFQQSASVDKGMTPGDIGQGRIDTFLGAALAALAGIGALVVASPLFYHHVSASAIQGGTGFAQALRPIVGTSASTLFSLGLIEAGAVAVLTISASTAYALGESIAGGAHSFNNGWREAPLFHSANLILAAIAGAVVLIPGAPLLDITLNANLLATVLMPATLVFLLVLVNDRALMGRHANHRGVNLVAVAIAVLVAVAGSAYAIVTALHP